uniref:Uncharacterized protein n=1 Tax=Anas platyrhynchos platyrhynchos TaxID=8840 RepID=U3J8R3_ANAPP
MAPKRKKSPAKVIESNLRAYNPMVSLKILLNAVKNIGEKTEDKINVLSPRFLKTLSSTGLNKGNFNVVSDNHDIQFIKTMANLQRQLEAAKDNNSKVIMMLEHVLASHSKMQTVLDTVQTELGHKDTEIKVARMDKKTLALRLEEVQQANNVLQSKLIHTQYDLKSKGAEHQQLVLFTVLIFSHANRDLQQKVIELEKTSSSYREKLKSQRAQVKCCLVTKANAGGIKEIETELREIEAIKEEYQKKNYEQVSFPDQFPLKSLRSEMQILLEKQRKVQVQNRQLETQLEAERRRVHLLENEHQMTNNLKEAQHWFKSEFYSLQLDCLKNHQLVNFEDSSSKEIVKNASMFFSESKENRLREVSDSSYWSELQLPKLFIGPYTWMEGRPFFLF